jgi:nucleotide-binding universal stress UspA family protein
MINKILVPVDGSENSEKGLRYACWLASKVEATITVLHIMTIPYTGESAVFHIEPLEAAGRMILERAKKVLKEENCAGAHFVLREGTGNPGHEIVKFSEEENISLIVMSAKGHTALAHLLMGSVSDMVTKHAPCPILIVKQKPKKQ